MVNVHWFPNCYLPFVCELPSFRNDLSEGG